MKFVQINGVHLTVEQVGSAGARPVQEADPWSVPGIKDLVAAMNGTAASPVMIAPPSLTPESAKVGEAVEVHLGSFTGATPVGVLRLNGSNVTTQIEDGIYIPTAAGTLTLTVTAAPLAAVSVSATITAATQPVDPEPEPALAVPTDADWSAASGPGERQTTITVSNAVAGAPDHYEYTYDRGRSYRRLANGAATGARNITMALPGTIHPFQLRAVKGTEKTAWSTPQGAQSRHRASPPAIAPLPAIAAVKVVVFVGASHMANSSISAVGPTTAWKTLVSPDAVLKNFADGGMTWRDTTQVTDALADPVISAAAPGEVLWVCDFGGNDLSGWINTDRSSTPGLVADMDAFLALIKASRPSDHFVLLPQSKRFNPWVGGVDRDVDETGMRYANETYLHQWYAARSTPAGAWYDTNGLPFVTSYALGEQNPGVVQINDGNHYSPGSSYQHPILAALIARIKGQRARASKVGDAYIIFFQVAAQTRMGVNPNTGSKSNIIGGGMLQQGLIEYTEGRPDPLIWCWLEEYSGTATNRVSDAAFNTRVSDARIHLGASHGMNPSTPASVSVPRYISAGGFTPGQKLKLTVVGTTGYSGTRKVRLKNLNSGQELILDNRSGAAGGGQVVFDPVIADAAGGLRLEFQATADSTNGFIEAIAIDVVA